MAIRYTWVLYEMSGVEAHDDIVPSKYDPSNEYIDGERQDDLAGFSDEDFIAALNPECTTKLLEIYRDDDNHDNVGVVVGLKIHSDSKLPARLQKELDKRVAALSAGQRYALIYSIENHGKD